MADIALQAIPEWGDFTLIKGHHEQTYGRHFHDGFAIGLVAAGGTEYYHRGAYDKIGNGIFYICPPGEVHSASLKKEESWTHNSFYFASEWLETLFAEEPELRAQLPFFKMGVFEDPELFADLSTLFSTLEHRTTTLLERQSSALLVFEKLIQKYASNPQSPGFTFHPKAVKLTQAYIHEHYVEDISLETLSAVAGCSAYHLIDQFKQYIGMPPHAYHLQVRLNQARQCILKTPSLSLTQLAADLGFYDQSHFTRAFKKAWFFSPSHYRKAVA